MKIFIASDIHGSAYYCNKMVKAFYKENADKLLLLGDVLYHGPRNDLPKGYCPKKVFAQLNALSDKIICVSGNCEAPVDQMVLKFPCMDNYKIVEADGIKLFATHGHIYNEKNPPNVKGFYVLLNGHTHVPTSKELDGFLFVNVGSVSIPKENSKHGYVILEDGIFTWKDLSGKAYKSISVK